MNRYSFRRWFVGFSVVCCSAWFLALPVRAAIFDPLTVHSETLPNGLRVIVAEEPEAPVIAVEVVVRVGAADEEPKNAGIAHLLEHVLWAYGGENDPRTLLESTGGVTNAGTLRDFTHYYATVPVGPNRMELTVQTLAKMVLRETIDEEVVTREKQIIIDELISNNDRPQIQLNELAFETLYGPEHPYSHHLESVGSAFHALDATKLGAFHRLWYVPNNMSVIVVGPVKFDAVKAIVERAYGALNRRPVPSRVIPDLPRPRPSKEIVLDLPGDTAYVMAAYLGPAINEPTEVCAIDTIIILLANGTYGRVRERLMETDPLALAVGVDFLTQKERGLVGVWAVCKPKDVAAVKLAMQAELARLSTVPPSPKELAVAKRLTTAAYAFGNETSSDRARTLAFYEALSNYREAAQYAPRVRSLRKEDIARVASWLAAPPIWVVLSPSEAKP